MDNPADPTSLKKQAAAAKAIGLPSDDSGVVDAYYPHPPKPHSHHLQGADGEVDCAAWSVGEGVRQKYQEDDNQDEVLKPRGK